MTKYEDRVYYMTHVNNNTGEVEHFEMHFDAETMTHTRVNRDWTEDEQLDLFEQVS